MLSIFMISSLLAVIRLTGSVAEHVTDVDKCAQKVIVFMDEFVHDYLRKHPLPNATIGGRATFYGGEVTHSSKAERLDPTEVYEKSQRVIIETRVKIPIFRATYKCKYQAIWEYPCANVNITTRDAIGLGVLSFDANSYVLKLEDMQLISANNAIEVSPFWLRPLLEQFTSERLKQRFGTTYKNIVNDAQLQLPETIAHNCIGASVANDFSAGFAARHDAAADARVSSTHNTLPCVHPNCVMSAAIF